MMRLMTWRLSAMLVNFGSRSLRADAERRAQTTNKGTIDRSMGINVKGRKSKNIIHEYLKTKKKSFERELAMYSARVAE